MCYTPSCEGPPVVWKEGNKSVVTTLKSDMLTFVIFFFLFVCFPSSYVYALASFFFSVFFSLLSLSFLLHFRVWPVSF